MFAGLFVGTVHGQLRGRSLWPPHQSSPIRCSGTPLLASPWRSSSMPLVSTSGALSPVSASASNWSPSIPYLSELVPATPARARVRSSIKPSSFAPFPWPRCSDGCWFRERRIGLDGWRWVVLLGALGAILVWWIRLGVPESPRWLAQRTQPSPAGFAEMSRPPYPHPQHHANRLSPLPDGRPHRFSNWVPTLLINARYRRHRQLARYPFIIAIAAPFGPLLACPHGRSDRTQMANRRLARSQWRISGHLIRPDGRRRVAHHPGCTAHLGEQHFVVLLPRLSRRANFTPRRIQRSRGWLRVFLEPYCSVVSQLVPDRIRYSTVFGVSRRFHPHRRKHADRDAAPSDCWVRAPTTSRSKRFRARERRYFKLEREKSCGETQPARASPDRATAAPAVRVPHW